MTLTKQLFTLLYPYIFIIALGGISFDTHSEGFNKHSLSNTLGGSDDDTILIEREAKTKISYSRAIKSAFHSLLGLDIDKFFSIGKNKRSEVIRHLDDLAERSHLGHSWPWPKRTLKRCSRQASSVGNCWKNWRTFVCFMHYR